MTNADKQTFLDALPAPRGAVEKLEAYAALLTEWNEKFNLVAPSTIPTIWTRHFLDSAQLMTAISPELTEGVLADIGSGAGFPGMVLAIMGKSNIHLIESTGKKADFLKLVADKLELPVTIHRARAEDMDGLKVDIITARAVSSLLDLLNYCRPLAKKETFYVFPKGQKADLELTEAQKYWMFDCKRFPSLSDASGSILAIRNLRQHASRSHRRHK